MASADCLLAVHAQNLAVCSATQRQVYISKSMTNVATLQKLHEGVFLGELCGAGKKTLHVDGIATHQWHCYRG
jgi:hypothetical protein